MRMPQPPTLVLAATLVLAVCAPGRAAPDLTPPWPSVQRLADIAGTRVTFPSSSPFVLSDRRASCEAPTAALATLFLPPGASAQSPAPAAIILHGAAGVMWARELTYARQLASMGVAALVIDAFAARRERASRFIDRLIEITEAMVLADAFAGLRYLAGRAVDAGRVALIGIIWTPPDGKDRFGAPGQAGCSFISGLLMQGLCLLALMESADPRLISPVGSWPDSRFRLGGSRSDLFAITPCRTLRNLSACHLLCGLVFPVASRAHAGWLTKSR